RFHDDTGINVEFLFGGDAELRERLASEGADTQADVYMTVDAANLALAAEQGLFQPVESQTLTGAMPANLRDPHNRWFGLSMRARTLVYDPDEVDAQQLSTYEALTQPRWQGRVCMRNSTNSYTQSLVASLIAHHGFDRALAALARNPLPAVVVVEPAGTDQRSTDALASMTQRLEGIAGVDRAQLDVEWVERLFALLSLLERAVSAVGALLGLGVLLIVGNTIRLEILNRRAEIEVTKLIGASNAFIRRPFLYSGLLYGLGGGLVAWALLAVGRWALAGPTQRLAAAYGSPFQLHGLGGEATALLVASGAVLGLLGAWVAVGRHLREIEPG
ncbi:MAG: hypothetical protein BRD57_04600, partial [Proteobacteria bacterium SW_6_67_9]